MNTSYKLLLPLLLSCLLAATGASAQSSAARTENHSTAYTAPGGGQPAAPAKPFRLDVRTNLLYDAFLLPTLGVEWRATPSVGIKLDGGYTFGGSEHGRVQKIWLLNPEVRWYLLDTKRFYVGASANFGEYNIYRGMVGGIFSNDTGYQGGFWGAGVTVGYRLPLNRALSLDFNLGLGYTRSEYDSFNMIDRTRVYRAKSQTKNLWGPTQAGVPSSSPF